MFRTIKSSLHYGNMRKSIGRRLVVQWKRSIPNGSQASQSLMTGLQGNPSAICLCSWVALLWKNVFGKFIGYTDIIFTHYLAEMNKWEAVPQACRSRNGVFGRQCGVHLPQRWGNQRGDLKPEAVGASGLCQMPPAAFSVCGNFWKVEI